MNLLYTTIQKTLPQEFPVVCKIGTIHAGFGKQKLDTKSQFDDFTTLMALYKDYFTCEPFCNVEYDLRLQKIGNHYRVYQRSSDSSWKNVSSSISTLFLQVPTLELYNMNSELGSHEI